MRSPEERARALCDDTTLHHLRIEKGDRGPCERCAEITSAIREFVEAEREACAKLSSEYMCECRDQLCCHWGRTIAARIRARQQGEG